jgi:hypothetical protein
MDSCGASPPFPPSGRVLSTATRHEPSNLLLFNRVVPLTVAAFPAREAPICVAFSFPDGLFCGKAAASSFRNKFPKADLPDPAIDFHKA